MNRSVLRVSCLLFGLAGILVLATSCATNQQTLGPKFREASDANLVIRYSSDSTIFRLKPESFEGRFYRIYNRQQICDETGKSAGERNLAVVVINYHHVAEVERQVKQRWVDNLSNLNYRRVVFLRAADTDEVNGLRVVEDRMLAQNNFKPQNVVLAGAAPQTEAR